MEHFEGMNRRTALKLIAGGAIAISLAACGYYDSDATKVEIGEGQYYLLKEKNYSKSPRSYQGEYYDVTNHKYVSKEDAMGILLPQDDFFRNERSLFHWRDTKTTPEMFQHNPVFQTIVQRTERYMEGAQKSLGGMYKDFVLPQAVATAVRKTLVYDTNKALLGSLSPFDFRLRAGLTNCQEYVATVANILAWFGKRSDVAMHTYVAPDGSGRRLDHLYSAVDIDNRCWIIDATMSDKVYPFWDYLQLQEKINNNPEGGVIKYDSVFPYQELPWENPAWTTTVSQQDKAGPNTVAFAMENIPL